MAVDHARVRSAQTVEDLPVAQRSELEECQNDSNCESEVTDSVDQERLGGGRVGAVPLVPVPDQQV